MLGTDTVSTAGRYWRIKATDRLDPPQGAASCFTPTYVAKPRTIGLRHPSTCVSRGDNSRRHMVVACRIFWREPDTIFPNGRRNGATSRNLVGRQEGVKVDIIYVS